MRSFIKLCMFVLLIFSLGCIKNDIFKQPALTGTWKEIGRKCDPDGVCGIKESNTIVTIGSDNTLVISTGSVKAAFYYKGRKFYRVYARENDKLSFSFEIVSLSDSQLVMRLFDENLNKKDTYAFTRIASAKKIVPD